MRSLPSVRNETRVFLGANRATREHGPLTPRRTWRTNYTHATSMPTHPGAAAIAAAQHPSRSANFTRSGNRPSGVHCRSNTGAAPYFLISGLARGRAPTCPSRWAGLHPWARASRRAEGQALTTGPKAPLTKAATAAHGRAAEGRHGPPVDANRGCSHAPHLKHSTWEPQGAPRASAPATAGGGAVGPAPGRRHRGSEHRQASKRAGALRAAAAACASGAPSRTTMGMGQTLGLSGGLLYRGGHKVCPQGAQGVARRKNEENQSLKGGRK